MPVCLIPTDLVDAVDEALVAVEREVLRPSPTLPRARQILAISRFRQAVAEFTRTVWVGTVMPVDPDLVAEEDEPLTGQLALFPRTWADGGIPHWWRHRPRACPPCEGEDHVLFVNNASSTVAR